MLWIDLLLILVGAGAAASSCLSEPQRLNLPAWPEAGAATAIANQRRFEIFMIVLSVQIIIVIEELGCKMLRKSIYAMSFGPCALL